MSAPHPFIRKALIAAPLAAAIAVLGLPAGAAPIKLIQVQNQAREQAYGKLETVAIFHDAMPTGVAVTEAGRIFVNFPRWGDDVPFTVGEVRGGKVVPYPDAAVNRGDAESPGSQFISVQSVVADGRNHLWVLDTAAPKFGPPEAGGAKLVAIDLSTNKIVKTIIFPPNVMRPQTYVNDVRFDFRVGKAGVAYVTDSSLSGTGGIIIVDLDNGTAVRRLTGDRSTSADPAFVAVVEGETLIGRNPDGTTSPFTVASDGIALSPDGKTLYFSPLSSRHLYSVPTDILRDPNASDAQVAAAVKDLGEKGASDGLEADANGVVYAGDYERNSIRELRPGGQWETIAHDPRILWPDTMSIGPDGYLYFTVNQLHRQPGFHAGRDLRRKPYSLFRIRIDSAPAPTH
ncbi:gluconolaconase [Bordetella genomosp. 8]|uniref:Gluconolaconase n=1 Tax=Bordetella genomosp. 8 TaxID=1416806 RepID=A0A1W6YHN7_9BORD|nr:L-dopachrome tautomerase-related protein [Bordetella genomosp. 8]ARP80551.1 gluconolaconase [Bordetella genomosp. 8]